MVEVVLKNLEALCMVLEPFLAALTRSALVEEVNIVTCLAD